jgi:hypothetical protein
LINSKLIDALSYDGQSGLRGFLRGYENQAISIPVEEPFIRLDADTRKDLVMIREKHLIYTSLQMG